MNKTSYSSIREDYKMTGLLHFTIFLCGVIATIACIVIYYYISDCIEASIEKKAREALEEMKNRGEIK